VGEAERGLVGVGRPPAAQHERQAREQAHGHRLHRVQRARRRHLAAKPAPPAHLASRLLLLERGIAIGRHSPHQVLAQLLVHSAHSVETAMRRLAWTIRNWQMLVAFCFYKAGEGDVQGKQIVQSKQIDSDQENVLLNLLS